MNNEQLKEKVEYLLGRVHGLEDGDAVDKGARIENDRNRESIQENKAKIRSLETEINDISSQLEVLHDQIKSLRNEIEEVQKSEFSK